MSEQFDPKELENALKGNVDEKLLEPSLTTEQKEDIELMQQDIQREIEAHLDNFKFEPVIPEENESNHITEDREKKAA